MRKNLKRKIFVYAAGLACVINGVGMYVTNEDWSHTGSYSDYPWAWGLLSLVLGVGITMMAWRKFGPPWRGGNR